MAARLYRAETLTWVARKPTHPFKATISTKNFHLLQLAEQSVRAVSRRVFELGELDGLVAFSRRLVKKVELWFGTQPPCTCPLDHARCDFAVAALPLPWAWVSAGRHHCHFCDCHHHVTTVAQHGSRVLTAWYTLIFCFYMQWLDLGMYSPQLDCHFWITVGTWIKARHLTSTTLQARTTLTCQTIPQPPASR
eukprot:m.233601 g.233601  ORF g.233601 m.233601 type:complete len:193 (-) comp17385_c2_seq27:434-1012(-)